ncbi:MAG: winged helix-turn-helix domain-containing protein [Rhodocyclaceae bacterium]|nr:winged helix-turn-helix domain-containing protein [Rhodocyclaceae bacterium]
MRVLVVEDDALLGDAVQVGLRQAGFVPDWITDGIGAEHALATSEYGAVVLDIGLPRRSGLEVLARMRADGNRLPVLILTARDTVDDRIAGLDAGADDYLVKPFAMGELAARLRALVRRAEGRSQPAVVVGAITLDPAAHTVTLDGAPVELSAKEFALLQVFMQNAGRVLSRAQLEEQLYGWDDDTGSNTIEVFIHHLRRKFGRDLIRTVRGVGYQLPRPGA